MRMRARIDTNHPEIVQALRQVGAQVQSLASLGRGVPDLMCGWNGRVYLLEVKRPGETLTPDERAWHARWGELVAVVHSPQEALNAIGVSVR
jgi:hypothetical protein